MSQAGIISIAAGGGATSFVEDVGVAVPVAGVLNIVGGAGISTSGAGNTVTITNTSTGFTWNVVAGVTQTLAPNNGYINDNVALTTYSLPALAAVGDTYQLAGKSAGLWTIAQNAGQTIHVGAASSTVGVAGSVAASQRRNCCEIVCTVANTDFTVLDFVGNLVVT